MKRYIFEHSVSPWKNIQLNGILFYRYVLIHKIEMVQRHSTMFYGPKTIWLVGISFDNTIYSHCHQLQIQIVRCNDRFQCRVDVANYISLDAFLVLLYSLCILSKIRIEIISVVYEMKKKNYVDELGNFFQIICIVSI